MDLSETISLATEDQQRDMLEKLFKAIWGPPEEFLNRHFAPERHKQFQAMLDCGAYLSAAEMLVGEGETYARVHDATQELTNNLDRIGLGDDCHFSELVVHRFHDEFIELATAAIGTGENR